MPSTYDRIATTTVSGTTSAIDFTSIPGSYTNLRLVYAPLSNANIHTYLQFNSDAGANYSYTLVYGSGTAATSMSRTSQNDIQLSWVDNIQNDKVSLFVIDIFSYAGSTNKTLLNSWASDKNGSGVVLRQVSLWRSTAAITSINITSGSSLKTGTTATLYGILKA